MMDVKSLCLRVFDQRKVSRRASMMWTTEAAKEKKATIAGEEGQGRCDTY